jgi:hypothetical protein
MPARTIQRPMPPDIKLSGIVTYATACHYFPPALSMIHLTTGLSSKTNGPHPLLIVIFALPCMVFQILWQMRLALI